MNDHCQHPKGLFITGTDTGVGKTQITCWITRWLSKQGLKVGVCKPAATGAERSGDGWIWSDIAALRKACNLTVSEDWIGPFRWHAPLAPPVAHKWETEQGSEFFHSGQMPSMEDYVSRIAVWRGHCDFLLVEGVGGLLCPLTDHETIADLAKAWGHPLLVVARLGLGTLNHTLLTIEAALDRGLLVAAVVLNSPQPEEGSLAELTNPAELARRLSVPVLGPIHYQADKVAIPTGIREIDWVQLAATSEVGQCENRKTTNPAH